jgi:23S rRNA (cytosine1962-C5)-methyltransferase
VRGTDAYRVVHGEGDLLPALVVDRYQDYLVLQTLNQGMDRARPWIVDSLIELFSPRGIVARNDAPVRAKEALPLESGVIYGEVPENVEFHMNGLRLHADLLHGQKTGAFLDQRENRQRVGELARGRRVLNLFSYAGGFSLHASLGGAAHVTSVDVAAAAHATAQASFRVAGVDPGAHAFVTADVRSFLDGARGSHRQWDLVISDPPSFAPSEKALPRALSAYRSLHGACAAVLAPGGILCAASCSSHVDASAFLATLDDAVLGDGELAVLEVRGAGPDHPTLAAFPEGRYLKFVVLA